MEESVNGWALLDSLIACPHCEGRLERAAEALLICTACGRRYPQTVPGGVDLLPDQFLAEDETRWEGRQEEMEAWYEDLSADSTAAYWCFTNDYGPFADLLATFCGTVLDLGGGNGVTRHYLRPDVRYVVVDPSFDWLGPGWAPMAESFPCLATPPPFVRGIGEQLPFRAGAFDAVLAFWSLNHVSDPERVFEEVRRVLRDGGRFLAVLEDMEPRWRDLLRPPFREHHARGVAAAFAVKLEAWLPGGAWPLQDDHLLIRERDLAAWSAARFEVVQRAWVGRYLTYEFRRRPSERP